MKLDTKLKLTSFQARVYNAVKAIPRGQVRSYKWVARKIGSPRACRAVGNALNKNPFAPVVPCHRVVKSDGSLGGFAKGAKAKLRLLKAEGLTLEKISDIIKRQSHSCESRNPKRNGSPLSRG
jgi:methylated-DNA-[protein]-cysteine S-methyltransferase